MVDAPGRGAMTGRNQILVIRGGAIGDFILTLPVLMALRRQFPETRLEVLGYPHIAQLAEAGGWVEAVRHIEARALAGFFARQGNLDPTLQDYFGSFAIILSYLYDPDGVFRENVTRCSKAEFIAAPHRPDDTAGLHATQVFLKPLERLAIWEADPIPRLTLEPLETTFPEAPAPSPRRAATLAVHPGSGSERKNWPESNWALLLGRVLEETDWRLLVVGGEAEGERLDRLSRALPRSRVTLARHLPLAELARRLAACDAFIGHDSGISHLAAAVGLPSLVLWGESVEAVWRPQGAHVTVLREERGLAQLPPERVLEWITSGRPLRSPTR